MHRWAHHICLVKVRPVSYRTQIILNDWSMLNWNVIECGIQLSNQWSWNYIKFSNHQIITCPHRNHSAIVVIIVAIITIIIIILSITAAKVDLREWLQFKWIWAWSSRCPARVTDTRQGDWHYNCFWQGPYRLWSQQATWIRSIRNLLEICSAASALKSPD